MLPLSPQTISPVICFTSGSGTSLCQIISEYHYLIQFIATQLCFFFYLADPLRQSQNLLSQRRAMILFFFSADNGFSPFAVFLSGRLSILEHLHYSLNLCSPNPLDQPKSTIRSTHRTRTHTHAPYRMPVPCACHFLCGKKEIFYSITRHGF